MGNHKRGKPKHQRAGCLYCKPHKDNGVTDLKHGDKKRKLIELLEYQFPDKDITNMLPVFMCNIDDEDLYSVDDLKEVY